MKEVAVIILNWNGKEFLEKFLPGVIEHSTPVARVVVADNASEDDSVEFLEKNFPQVEIVRNAVNGGFSQGYNDALEKIRADYYILLNSDIEVTPGWIEPVIELMESDKNIGACQPKILAHHDKEMFEYAGAAGGYIDKYGYPFCRGRFFQTLEKDLGQYDDNREIFWATGACMFVKADLYHRLGGLDEDFFAHMEEIDFCWRLKNAGYKVMYCAGSKIYHVGGGTLPKSSSRKTFLNFRNNTFLMYKNLPSRRLPGVFLSRYVLDFAASLKFLLEGDFRDFFAVIRAHIAFWKNYPRFRKKRERQKHPLTTGIYQSNIAMDYFLKKKRYFSELDESKFS